MSNPEFTEDQKKYLEGFVSGTNAARSAQGLVPFGAGGRGAAAPSASTSPAEMSGPDAEHHKAMARTEAAGGKLVKEEKAKRDEHPFDIYARMKAAANEGVFPKGIDAFRWKFHGLFHVAPTQDSFMCRLRISNGILSHWQFRGVADLAQNHGGGYSHVTTRGNLQVREIPATDGMDFIEGLEKVGLTSKGSGGDNIRNVTGSPLAGIDPQELLSTRKYADDWHHYVLNTRTMYGLPRKFNVAFDGGGTSAVLEDTNDIGFQAVEVRDGQAVDAGIYFRLILGGITGHEDFARDTGVIVPLDEATQVADAIIRVFIAEGDRTNRNKARLKYVLDDWGFDKFLAAVEELRGKPFARLSGDALVARKPHDRFAHVGVHPQKQDGESYIGVVVPVGKLDVAQMHALADISGELGDGDIRLTVWQNLIISGVKDHNLEAAKARIEACGLEWQANSIRAGLVACTGSNGCKFGGADTKRQAIEIAEYVETRVTLDQPINIHLTGCHHTCAQHYIGDLGLIGARVAIDEESEDTVDGYHIFVGGGFGENAKIGRELVHDARADECPVLIENILKAYMDKRENAQESFFEFSNRHEIADLQSMMSAVETEGATA